jgi:hypothetical protein
MLAQDFCNIIAGLIPCKGMIQQWILTLTAEVPKCPWEEDKQ